MSKIRKALNFRKSRSPSSEVTQKFNALFILKAMSVLTRFGPIFCCPDVKAVSPPDFDPRLIHFVTWAGSLRDNNEIQVLYPDLDGDELRYNPFIIALNA